MKYNIFLMIQVTQTELETLDRWVFLILIFVGVQKSCKHFARVA